MRYVNVIVPKKLDKALTYVLDRDAAYDESSPHAFVRIIWHGKPVCGVIAGGEMHPPKGKTLKTADILPLTPLSPAFFRFIQRMSDYTLIPIGHVWRMVLGGLSVEDLVPPEHVVKAYGYTPQLLALNEAQEHAVSVICQRRERHHTYLLHGVTGSGKTEVYFHSIQKVLDEGRQVLVLLPEIGLSHPWLYRFESQFGQKPLVWHSHATPKTRRETWYAARSNNPCVVVGARSALFLPFSNLGLIIVDEEHDPSFKQEEQGSYHARDMAVLRGAMEHIPVVLSSATPSLESYEHAQNGKYTYVHLPKRFGDAQFPHVTLIDRKRHKKAPLSFHREADISSDTPADALHDAPAQNPPYNPPQNPSERRGTWMTLPLYNAIKDRLMKKEQSLLFLNRRGYAPITLCTSCGHIYQCPGCSSYLVQHRMHSKKHKVEPDLFDASISSHDVIRLQCHYCGFVTPLKHTCPACQDTDSLIACGPGVDRVVSDLEHFYPSAHIIAFSSEMTAKEQRDAWATVYTSDAQKRPDIIVGTQMIAKGHHMPDLTLVGIVDGDMSLQVADLRTLERTFQILHQVGGRAGRSEKPGEVFVQTYQPEHPLFQFLQSHDHEGFLRYDMEQRRDLNLPPFSRLIALVMAGRDLQNLEKGVQSLVVMLKAEARNTGIAILGPSPAMMFQLRGVYRYRVFIRSDKSLNTSLWLKKVLALLKMPSSLTLSIDVDPMDFA